jgi:hypothetical protein
MEIARKLALIMAVDQEARLYSPQISYMVQHISKPMEALLQMDWVVGAQEDASKSIISVGLIPNYTQTQIN